MNHPRRLHRSTHDRIIAGVAGGVAEYFDVDPTIVRVIWLVSMIVTTTLTFWIYVVMIFVVPEGPADWPAPSPWAPGGEPIGGDAAGTPAVGAVPAAEPGASTGPAPEASWWTGGSRWQSHQEQWQHRTERSEYRAFGGPGIAVGLLLIVIGGMLAWHQVDPRLDLNLTWPVAVIALGVILVASSFRFRGRS